MKRRRVFRLGYTAILGLGALVAACGWDPARPFDRDAPQVNEALDRYDSGAADAAAELLEEYLSTGGCKDGKIGTPLRVRDRSNGSFDLGLAMFRIAETYGRRFGDEESDAGIVDPSMTSYRTEQVDCALSVVRAVAEDNAQPIGLRLRARYLEGNLLFMTAAYKEAVAAYDTALELVPAMGDAGPIGANVEAGTPYTADATGRDAAWNRAVALRRIEEKKTDGGDQNDAGGDGGGGSESNDPKDAGTTKDAGGKNQGKNKKDKKDKERDAGKKDEGDKEKKPPEPSPDAGAEPPPPPSRQNQDDRILDKLENAPTVQQEAAKKQAGKRKVPRGMVDK